MKVAFYASMKPPDDPVPSGDRTMARQLFKAMELAGHDVELISRMKCRVRSPQHLDEVRADAAHEVKRIAAHWRAMGAPDVIVTYHVYYKSPDLIGAELARQFHPDVNPGDARAEAQFQRIRQAYELLGDYRPEPKWFQGCHYLSASRAE